MKNSITLSVLVLAMLSTGCATIVSGSKQTVKFTSNPTAATIYIDEVEVGKTPFEIKLKRKTEHHVMIKLDGYETYQTNLTKKFNAWFIGNIALGGLIGIIVDPITGAMYNLTPKELHAEMSKDTVVEQEADGLYFGVSLKVDPNWQKIGQLESLEE